MSYFDRPLEKSFVESILQVDCEAGKAVWISPTKYHPDLFGQEAGCARPTRSGKFYWHIKIDRIPYKRADIVFLCAHGRWPSMMLDHKNGDSLDDGADNLREATTHQNAWNHKGRAKKSDLPLGVRLTPGGRYSARIGHMNKLITLGTFGTPEEAHAKYMTERKERFGEFQNH